MRRLDEKRKEKRRQREDRKRREVQKEAEMVKRLKTLKKEEIKEKLSKIVKEAAVPEVDVDVWDLDSDFDPDKHDQKMKQMFDDKYYQVLSLSL